MNFSIFGGDDGLGDLANARAVVLRGSTTVNALFNSSGFPIESWLRQALEGAGFAVIGVRYSWLSSVPFMGNGINVEIEIDLYNWHTADEARKNAMGAIESYTANFGLNKVFSNTTLSVAYDAYVPPASGNTGSTPKGNAPKTGGPPSNYDTSQIPAGSGSSQFLDNLGLGLGVSTPVVIGAGMLLLVLMLRR